MRNLKKLLAVIVTIAMIATFAIPAFASSTAPAASVSDADTKAAVERLSGLGIVNGMGDGKFHEELDLTREDFTKMLVVALNLNNAATAAKGTTKFSDVASTRWSSGFVNVGVSKGIIKGYSNGKFGPADKLTEAQAITMLVRALGYKDAWLEGTWPDNMINRADEIGMLDDITLGGGIANRGTAALLLNNALDCELVTQSGFGADATWTIDAGSSILADKLGYAETEGTVTSVPAVDEDLDADEIVITDSDDETHTFTVKQEGLDLNGLLLKDVTVLADDDDAALVTVDTDAEDIVVGTITDIDGNTLTIKGADGEDEDYDFVPADIANGDIYLNYSTTNIDENDFAIDQYGTFILNDDGEIAFANLFAFDNAGVVVTEVNADKQYVKAISGTATTKIELDATDGLKVFKDGAEIALSDIKVDDVLYTVDVPFGEDTYTYVFVVTNNVTGTLKKAKVDELTVDTTAYTASNTVLHASDMIYTTDDGDTKAYYAATDNLEDVLGESVKVYLDIKGEVRYLVSNVDATGDVAYGISQKDAFLVSGDDAVKLYTKDDKDVTYLIDENDNGINKGDIVSYSVNSDGAIDDGDITVIADGDALTADVNDGHGGPADGVCDASLVDDGADEYAVTAFDDEENTMTIGGVDFYVNDDTVIMSYYDSDGAFDPTVVNWDDIKDKNVNARAYYVENPDDDGVLSLVVFTDNFSVNSDGYSAYLTGDAYQDADGVKVDVVLADGTEASYVVAGADRTSDVNIGEGDFVVFDTNADGEMDTVQEAVYDNWSVATGALTIGDYDAYHGDVVSFDNNLLKVNTNGVAGYTAGADFAKRLTDETPIYVLTLDDGAYDSIEAGDLSDIEEGAQVRVIMNDTDVDMVIVIQ